MTGRNYFGPPRLQTPLAVAVYNELESGPLTVDALVALVGHLIPAGCAWRIAEVNRARQRFLREQTDVIVFPSRDDNERAIQVGRRIVVCYTIYSLRGRRILYTFGERRHRSVARVPGVHAVVALPSRPFQHRVASTGEIHRRGDAVVYRRAGARFLDTRTGIGE